MKVQPFYDYYFANAVQYLLGWCMFFMKCTVYCGVDILSHWRNRKPQKQLEKENSREGGQPPHN